MKRIITIIMSVALLVCLAIPTFAATSYPEIPGANDAEEFKYTEEILFQRDNGSIHCVVIGYNKDNTILNISYNSTDSDKYLYGTANTGGGEYAWYSWYLLENIDGTAVWSRQRKSYMSEGMNSRMYINDVETFLTSTVDIVDYNNNSVVVFQKTPSVNQTVAEELEALVAKPITQAMALLTVCGIGLMALLIVLKILPKVFSIFLSHFG